jgi:hypothetical protein
MRLCYPNTYTVQRFGHFEEHQFLNIARRSLP